MIDRRPSVKSICTLVRAPVERSPDVLLTGVHEVVQERFALVALHAVLRVEQAQRGGGDHGLLDRHVRVALRGLQVAVGVPAEPERSRREPRQLPGVAVGERDHRAVRGQVVQPFERIGHEARLGLLAVRDHGRARRLEPLDRVAERPVAGAR